jgi:hypothetical protein
VDRAFNLVDGQGRQLRGYWDEEGQTYATQLISPEGEILRASAVSHSPQGQVVSELDPRAIEELRTQALGSGNGILDEAIAPRQVGVDPRTQLATASEALTNMVSLGEGEGVIPRALAFAGLAAPGVVPQATAEWLGARGNALAGAIALTTAGQSFAIGDFTNGAVQLGNGLTDVASLTPSPLYHQGFRALEPDDRGIGRMAHRQARRT